MRKNERDVRLKDCTDTRKYKYKWKCPEWIWDMECTPSLVTDKQIVECSTSGRG